MKNEFLLKHITELSPIMEECLRSGKKVRLTVVGNSMFPLFSSKRDSVVLSKKESYRKYDIIFYRRENGACILHRIVAGRDGAFFLCGDNQTRLEYPVYPGQILGAVEAFQRKGKMCSIKSLSYRLYTVLWCAVRPLRPALLSAALKLRRIIK
ncbi:S24/S26 family peptidase [Acetivibrio sp. MSJd-27]|uniref:S24/S26 family peptidase n=1 Tax=Acetivibrio sp. MSJd-27 TaxID=2841523 RepID=UPI001C11A362|nr:S24/S26 family peptidase [Acetivibrio sp. MSJd-27]MBU5450564.1 S24/S26 family peptidase [Acetivibrio sp. MSJd-27]